MTHRDDSAGRGRRPCDGCTGGLGRRRFLLGGGVGVVAAILLPPSAAWAGDAPKRRRVAVSLDKAEALNNVGGGVLVTLGGREVLVVRDGEDSVSAINPMCTHKECTVEYAPDANRFACPCHKSAFALDGTVLSGPAPAPLEAFRARLQRDKGRVVIDLPAATEGE